MRPNTSARRQLRTLFNVGTIGELTDGQLLERFATRDGEAAELAFAAVIERHGAMVLRVCRSRLRDPNDVQDAFQATFLVLVQKARSLWVSDSLGPWLYRVALRAAIHARSLAIRRREHELRAALTRPTVADERGERDELGAILHDEIDQLPERYRVPVVLCDVQGLTHEKAARHLGWPVGTVKSRLGRARELLRGRLSRRGLGLPAGLLMAGTGLGGTCRAAEVLLPATLVESTVRAAVSFAAGKTLAAGAVSSRVVLLIEEVLGTMSLTKWKLVSVLVLLVGAGTAGVLAQAGSGPNAGATADQGQERLAPAPMLATTPAAPTPAPAYITQSRAMIVTRLEEEVAEARARLDRIRRIVRSPDDPAVVRASKTLDGLQQQLDRIDRVLVEVVDAYPTMVDFSGDPSGFAPHAQSAADPGRERQTQADLNRQKARADWAKKMFDKGYLSEAQRDADVADYEALKARSQAGQPRQNSPQQGQPNQPLGLPQGRQGSSPNNQLGQQPSNYPQQGQSPDQRQPNRPSDLPQGSSSSNKGQRPSNYPQQRQTPDQGQPDRPSALPQRQQGSSSNNQPDQPPSNDPQQGQTPDGGQQGQQQPGQEPDKASQGKQR